MRDYYIGVSDEKQVPVSEAPTSLIQRALMEGLTLTDPDTVPMEAMMERLRIEITARQLEGRL